eukprot:m.751143 g.751143  ORF g.751143 m.751143 type:complete len:223 (-) comp23164_c0_seq5:631-1299(-)
MYICRNSPSASTLPSRAAPVTPRARPEYPDTRIPSPAPSACVSRSPSQTSHKRHSVESSSLIPQSPRYARASGSSVERQSPREAVCARLADLCVADGDAGDGVVATTILNAHDDRMARASKDGTPDVSETPDAQSPVDAPSSPLVAEPAAASPVTPQPPSEAMGVEVAPPTRTASGTATLGLLTPEGRQRSWTAFSAGSSRGATPTAVARSDSNTSRRSTML